VTFIAYKIGRHLGADHATKRLNIVVHIASKKSHLTFLSKLSCLYETLRAFVWFTRILRKVQVAFCSPVEIRDAWSAGDLPTQ
jgi:hypothetical protein